jgi:hypothetical protein
MPRKVKAAAVSSDLLGTADNDVFFIQDGSVNVSGFDPAHDKLLFVGNGYSDIMYLGQLSRWAELRHVQRLALRGSRRRLQQ